MTVKELILVLKNYDQDGQVLVSSDEELNTLFSDVQLAILDEKSIVIYGLSGSEE